SNCRHRRACSVRGLEKVALEFSETTGPLAFRRNYALTFGRVVLACASSCREFLSISVLRKGWTSDREFFVVLGHRATDRHIEFYPDSLDHGASRFVGRSAFKVFRSLLLVAGFVACLRPP